MLPPSTPALRGSNPNYPAPVFPVSMDLKVHFVHATSFQQAGGYFPPRSKWASQRLNNKSNQRIVSVTEICKMKDVKILSRVWSNTCSVSRLGWAWGHSPYQFGFWSLKYQHQRWGGNDSLGYSGQRSRMAKASPTQTAEPALGNPTHLKCQRMFWAERWMLHWKETLRAPEEGPSAVSWQCWDADLGTPAKLLTAIPSVSSCGRARHYHPPFLGGEVLPLSSIATLGFTTLDCPVQLVYKRFKLTELALPEMQQGALHRQIRTEELLPPHQKAHFQKGFFKQPQQRLHIWQNNISTQFLTDVTQTHPLN